MKKQILKFPILTNEITIEMPEGAEILTIQNENETTFLWVLADPENKKKSRSFEVYMTDDFIKSDTVKKYIGTSQLNGGGGLTYHLFEVIS